MIVPAASNSLGAYLLTSVLIFLVVAASCGGDGSHPQSQQNTATNLCACQPSEPPSSDFRHDAKHVPIPMGMPQEITAADVLGWTQEDPAPAADAPRTGRELQLFHIARAYLQVVYLNPGDCDIHVEISDTADKMAPRFIAETPVDSSFCPSRQALQSQLANQGVPLPPGGDQPTPIPVEIIGLAFADFEHSRGSPQVATTWELHPANISILP